MIAHDKQDDVINNEARQILKTDKLMESDAEFLIAVGKIDETEKYLLRRADKLDGNHYGSLLVSILERGYTKAYPHGIRYLKKLDKLAVTIPDWKTFNNHETFKEQIIDAHGRKRSFWSKI